MNYCKLNQKKKLISDISTRLNNTYHMLYCALQFENVFPRYAVMDKSFKNFVPCEEDWAKVGHVCSLLKVFVDANRIVSGCGYPTSNLFLLQLKRMKKLLDRKVLESYSYMREMTSTMQEMLDEYWKESNLMMSIEALMDPRFRRNLWLIIFLLFIHLKVKVKNCWPI